MAIVAVGSLAFDSINTSKGKRERVLGGSLTHFANAAAFLSKPDMVGVVGGDFGDSDWDFIKSKANSIEGIEILKDEKCFYWEGVYSDDFEKRDTLKTDLNAFAKFDPMVPLSYRAKGPFILFLANIDPVIQKKVVDQSRESNLRILDTMNFWISSKPKELSLVLDSVDGIIVNEEEAFQLTGEKNIIRAADRMFRPHFKMIIVKKGANGVMVFGKDFIVSFPAFPLRDIIDPTGAGDSFAGAFISWLDRHGRKYDQVSLKNAAAYATVVASFAVEDFGVDGLNGISKKDINKRLKQFRRITAFK